MREIESRQRAGRNRREWLKTVAQIGAYQGFMEGAALSGIDAATAILATLKR